MVESAPSSALVIWGTTGKRLQFTRQDLRMPESVKKRPNHHFFEKQWDAVAGFWMNRVLKEMALQHMSVEDIVQCIVSDIEKRWDQRKKEKTLYKKRKRLLSSSSTSAFGAPSPHVLITNIVSLKAYRELVADDNLQGLVSAVLGRMEEIAKEKVVRHTIMVDDDNNDNGEGNDNNNSNEHEESANEIKEEKKDDHQKSQEQPAKMKRLEKSAEVSFDDRVALVCTFSSEAKAARVVGELHGKTLFSCVVQMPARRCYASRVGISESCALATAMRHATTGEHHSYRPGRVAKIFRSLYVAITPTSLHKSLAVHLQVGMERVQELEKEQLWLRRHGSPLRVMGLPEHAELTEVRSRYRDLVFATHPDTAQGEAKEQYNTIQTAYRMATTPTSLWHQNGSAPELYRKLRSSSNSFARRVDRVTLFAFFSYCVMGLVGIFFSVVVVRQLLEVALRFFDPEFYAFMVAQEEEEERQRLAGNPVDTDPKRLAPTVVKRLLFPGRFVHNDDKSEADL